MNTMDTLKKPVADHTAFLISFCFENKGSFEIRTTTRVHFIVVGITYGKERLAAQQDGVVGRCKYRSEMIKSGYDGQKAVQQSRVNGDGSIAKIHGG
jgi:hypothetical protein